MKIALVTGEFPPMEGGVGAFTQELAKALHVHRQEVHIITNRLASKQKKKERFGRSPAPVDLGFAQLHANISRWRWPSIAAIADLTLRHEFDVVNIQYQPAAFNMNSPAINLLPWRLKHLTRTVVTFHDLRTPYLFPKAGPIRDKAITFMAGQAAGVIATNSDDFKNLQTRVDTQLTTIPIGSNIEAYQANHIEIAEARDNLGLRDDDTLLGYFGFVNESKGADTLVRTLASLPSNYHLVFIGGKTGASDQTNENSLAQIGDLIDHLDLDERVHWTGFLSDNRVSTFLKAADLMVMPYRDGVSLRRGTLMATLVHGCPIITTTPSSPIPELVHGKILWLVEPDDEGELAAAITTLMQDDHMRQTLGNGARRVATQFSWDEIARRTIAFYNQIEDPRQKGAPRT